MFVDVPLFPEIEPAPVVETEKLSAGVRRTLRQRQDLEAGRHPMTGAPLHPDAAPVDDRKADGLRCRSCRFIEHHGWPKCMHPAGRGNTRSTASDARLWHPACVHYELAPRETEAAG
jgi:hypothetical protein